MTIRAVEGYDKDLVSRLVREHWGAEFIVSRGRKVDPCVLEGFLAVDDGGSCLGLITYATVAGECEIVTLDAFTPHKGVGTRLLSEAIDKARGQDLHRVWLITSNDNLDAIRFYQRRGFSFSQIHRGAISEARKLKPSIPIVGRFGIPINDEIELELVLCRQA